MNVMAQAHKMVKEAISKLSKEARYVGQYARMLKLALKEAHKEFKAMQNPIAAQIAKTETFIAELKAADTQGFVMVVGEHRVCVNAEIGHAINILMSPIYMRLEDAQYYASRVQNAKGEKGMVIEKLRQLKHEIAEQEKLLETLKKFA